MRDFRLALILLSLAFPLMGNAEGEVPDERTSGGLSQGDTSPEARKIRDTETPFEVPRPAHAQSNQPKTQAIFRVQSSHRDSSAPSPRETGRAEYFLPEPKTGTTILPEDANLNLANDTELLALDTEEKIVLPAGTYRQILKFPINSPMIREGTKAKDLKSPTIEMDKPKSRYAEPPTDPIWVRYESLEKIRIGEVERRGGLDIPSHGPKNLGPRVWYAKSETADLASSVFYFVFGGLGYGVANLAGWSAGNIREVPNNFEYRLVRR